MASSYCLPCLLRQLARDRVRLGLEPDHVRVSRHDHVPGADARTDEETGTPDDDGPGSGDVARDEEGPR